MAVFCMRMSFYRMTLRMSERTIPLAYFLWIYFGDSTVVLIVDDAAR